MGACRTFPIPLSYFSTTIGLFALGLSWRYGAAAGLMPAWPGEGLLAAAFAVWLVLVAAYVCKILAYRDEFLGDLTDLVQCCFLSAIPITTILAGIAGLPYAAGAARVLVYAGIAGQLAFAMYRAAGLWRGLHNLAATTPVIYLPTVATNFVSATALGVLGLHDYAVLFFGAGLLSWFSLEAAILGRLRTEAAIAPQVRGIVGIQLAPAFVGYGCLQFLLLLRLLGWFAEGGFSMSWWGFSFGLAAMCGCGLHLLAAGKMVWLGAALVLSGSAGVALLLAGTLYLVWQGRFLVR